MKKLSNLSLSLFLNLFLILGFLGFFSALTSQEAKANYFFSAGGGVAYAGAGYAGFAPGVFGGGGPRFWGGGYSLNSLAGGGWAGYPAGYGVPSFAAGGCGDNNYYHSNCGGNCGALTGGFGGFYSPFIH